MPVARPSDKQGDLLHKWAAALVPSDTVTVGRDDSCVSIQFGKVLGIFEPGEHRLPAAIPDGVELWFCSTRPVFGTKFGGNIANGQSAFGDFSFRVSAPHLLVPQLAATDSADRLIDYVKTIVTRELKHGFAVHPPSPATMGDAESLAQERINSALEPLGVKFSGFGMMNIG